MAQDKNSIVVTVVLGLGLAVALLLGALGTLAYRTEKARQMGHLLEDLAGEAGELALNLALPVAGGHAEEVEAVLDSAMNNPKVQVLVFSRDGRSQARVRGAQGGWRRLGTAAPTAGLVLQERPVVLQGRTLGRIQAFGDPRFVDEGLRRFMVTLLIWAGVSLVVLGLAVYLLLWNLVLKPLKAVVRFAVAVSSGGTGSLADSGAVFRGELEGLRHAIEKMVRLLANRYADKNASEAKFRTLFNSTGDAIFVRPVVKQGERATFMEVNEVACHRTGYSREELLTMGPQDLTDPRDMAVVLDGYRKLEATGRASYEVDHLTKSGVAYPAEVKLNLVELDGRPMVLSVVRDVTRRKEGEEQLKQSLARLQATLESTADGILVVAPHGPISDYNRQFAEMWGIPESILARGDDDLAMDHILGQLTRPEAFLARVGELHAELTASTFDVLELWDGRVFESYSQPMLLDGVPAGRVWSFRDITARSEAQKAVHRLSQAVEQSPVSILITDAAGTLEFVNPHFTRLTGFTSEEAVGQNPRILKSGLTPLEVYQELWATVTAGKVWTGVMQNKKKSGEFFWERATISPITDPQGAITGYMGIKEDITGQKALENQLRHAQKLEAVGQLAGGVAHDFNNILQVINGYGTLMQMTLPERDPNRANMGEILKAAERAAQLTHSLLAFSRKQIMNPKVVNLNTVVGNVEKFLRRVIGEDIQLRTTRDTDPLPVHVDIGQIEQVLMNLATNARDAMPGGGTLTVETRLVHTEGLMDPAFGVGRPGTYAMLTVTDTGRGMDEATQKRIFDPFFTTKEMGRGTGLGLSIVYGIIKQHNGYITAVSEHGQGTTILIHLPIAETAAGEGAPAPVHPSRVTGTETVLVAEDEEPVRTMVQTVLQKFGYRVILASDGQEAVDQFRAHRAEIKLILMDIIMPRMGGRQAYEAIRLQDPAAKVLFTSGYTADFIKSRGELEQGMELLMKPVQPLDLLRKMREMLDR